MATVHFSSAAEADLVSIGDYTLRNWGEEQTFRYLNAIQDCCERLAENPMLGRRCDEIRPGLRRMKQGKHVIFYRPFESGIRVSRILHQSMAPESQFVEDEL